MILRSIKLIIDVSQLGKAMKKFATIFLAISIIILSNIGYGSDEELKTIQNIISTMSSDIKAENIKKSPVNGWYTITKGAYVAYISSDGRHLIQGDMYDIETQVNLTETIRNESRKNVIESYPEKDMIVFSPESKSHHVTVFTDVDCTFCRRLHNQIDEYLNEGIEIRYLMYPRSGPQSASWVIAEQIWCSADRNDALTLAKIDQNFDYSQCNSAAISSHYLMGQSVGLQGTPAIILEDGSMVNGYVSALELSKIIESN